MGSNGSNDWTWWKKAKADPSKIGTGDLVLHEGVVHEGYYRLPEKDPKKGRIPVGFYHVNGILIGVRNGNPISGELWETFSRCCRHPVEYAAYQKALAGGGWDDEPAPVGHNSRALDEDADDFDRLMAEWQAALDEINDFLRKPVTTQEQADYIAVLKKRLNDIRKRADQFFENEKAPIRKMAKDVDEKWRPLREGPEEVGKKLTRHNEPWLKKQAAEEAARLRKAREEAERIRREAEAAERQRREAEERARREAEEARRRQEELDRQEEEGAIDEAAADAERARIEEEAAARQREAEEAARAAEEEARRRQEQADAAALEAKEPKVGAGRTGAKMSLVTVRKAIVEDYAKAAVALVRMKHPDIISEIDRIAAAQARANIPFDGMRIVETQEARG